jgi:putative two-component system response regulator
MDIPVEKPEPDAPLLWDHVEWRRLQGAMLHLETSARSTPRVLIVDDDPATRLLYALNLELEGLLVLEAGDGRSGLERARAELPDLVLTDVMMPGLDGFELAEAMRRDRRTRGIPFIFLSGEVTAGHEARAHELGALAYLTKPVDVPALASLVAGVFAPPGAQVQPTAPGDGGVIVSDSAA